MTSPITKMQLELERLRFALESIAGIRKVNGKPVYHTAAEMRRIARAALSKARGEQSDDT